MWNKSGKSMPQRQVSNEKLCNYHSHWCTCSCFLWSRISQTIPIITAKSLFKIWTYSWSEEPESEDTDVGVGDAAAGDVAELKNKSNLFVYKLENNAEQGDVYV